MSIEEVIDRAIMAQQSIEIEYCTRSGRVFSCKNTDIGYSQYYGGGYIQAYHTDMGEVRTFKVSRIRVRLTYTCERNFDMVPVIDSKAACMEPVEQLSWSDSFKNVSPRDTEVRYSYYGLGQGTHSIETEYYLDRPGTYEIGVATIECTYAPEFRAVCKSQKIKVLK